MQNKAQEKIKTLSDRMADIVVEQWLICSELKELTERSERAADALDKLHDEINKLILP